jgi:hypothetical protein
MIVLVSRLFTSGKSMIWNKSSLSWLACAYELKRRSPEGIILTVAMGAQEITIIIPAL